MDSAKYIEILAITIIIGILHFIFSKIMAKPKPESLMPPREKSKARKSPLFSISEDLCYLSVIFTFFFLNDLLHLVQEAQPLPKEVRDISPYILWFLMFLAVVYVMSLSLNRKAYCCRWELSQSEPSATLRFRNATIEVGTILLSIIAIGTTFFFTLRIFLKYF